jgi:uncharacterized protein YxeA
MKNILICVGVILIAIGFASCRKTSFIDSTNARIKASKDTVRFDTVFTTTGSVTQSFKIFNVNDQKLRLSNVRLMGGNASSFKINVDGTAGTSFDNIELEANDSLYVFVSVVINPTAANLPFIVQDSISINYNGNQRFVQLEAFGQNANFLRNARVTKDSSWTNNLPIVILGSVSVDPNATLTINKGTKVFFHADAPMIVDGTLKVVGEKFDSTKVVFAGDRLDQFYRDFPGSWPGIYFSPTSKNNVLTYAVLKNAFQGIIAVLPSSTGVPKVTLNECTLDNIYDVGILSVSSNISARNCLISNCGNNIGIAGGGTYNFTHCTVVSYGNFYLDHKKPVLFISDANGPQISPLNATFKNCIFWGDAGAVDNEIVVDRKGTAAFTLNFENVLYRAKGNPAGTFTASLKNEPPAFDSINTSRRIFDFRINRGISPVINKGSSTSIIPFDLEGKPRGGNNGAPDLGCYEKQQ